MFDFNNPFNLVIILGDGLGRSLSGSKEPLKLDIKSDRRGLSAYGGIVTNP